MSLDNFKKFVKDRPGLVNYVKSGEKTWQDFYEMYELYGENNDVWKDYVKVVGSSPITIKDFIGMFKNIDMSEVQNSINSIQKGIGYLENMVRSKETPDAPNKTNYEARPMYRYFDD